MKYILSLIIGGALVVSGFGQTRSVLVGTNSAVVQPTNFWSADASNARTGLGLGTAATNPASAFQPSSAILSNLASGSGLNITNIAASNIVGAVAVVNGGTGATNAAEARTNLGLGITNNVQFAYVEAPWFFVGDGTNGIEFETDASRNITLTNLGLGATNAVTFGQLSLGSDLVIGDTTTTWSGNNRINYEELRLQGGSWQIDDGSLIIGGGTNLSLYQAQTRTNLGLGWSALTNTDATNFRNAIGLGTTNNVQFNSITDGSSDLIISNGAIYWTTNLIFEPETTTFNTPVSFSYGAATRTNLGLPWSGLTNTNAATFQTALFGANTNPVLVDTNGEVVSPTNFWQAAPITTTFIESQPTTNFTTNITAARFLHIHSLNTNIVNVTNTIALPTNGSTYNGDVALIVHQGPTNSMTRVRAVGSTNDIATMTRYNEAIEFVYYNNNWTFNHNEAFTEPIYFAGTNAAGHAAESRTNLGLGNTNDVTFNSATLPDGVTLSPAQDGDGSMTYDGVSGLKFEKPPFVDSTTNFFALFPHWDPFSTNSLGWRIATSTNSTNDLTTLFHFSSDGEMWAELGASFGGEIDFRTNTAAAATRTNLGIPLAALTNTTVTNFQKAIFYTNTAPSNIGGNLGTIAAWIEIVASNGVTYKIPAYTNVP